MGAKLWSCKGLVDSDGRCYNDDCRDPAHSAEEPPTLAEACEVIEALLGDAHVCDGKFCTAGPCTRSRAFLARVTGR